MTIYLNNFYKNLNMFNVICVLFFSMVGFFMLNNLFDMSFFSNNSFIYLFSVIYLSNNTENKFNNFVLIFKVTMLTLYSYCFLFLFFNTYNFTFETMLLIPDIILFVLLMYFLMEGLFVTTAKDPKYNDYYPIKSGYYCVVLGVIVFITGLAQFFLGFLHSFVFMGFETLFYYNSLNVGSLFLLVKGILSLLVSFILFLTPNFLKNNKLNNYEFSFILVICLISLWLSISAESWLILYLSLELQALCLLILIAWSRNLIISINTALKYGIINFLASSMMLYGIVRLILITGELNFSVQTYFYSINYAHDFNFVYFLICIFVGLFIKMGVAPVSAWIPEIYAGLPLPVLLFFSTVPKLVYVFLITRFLYLDFLRVSLVDFRLLFILLAVLTALVGAFGLMNEKKDIMRFIGWSSILNLGLLFLFWGLSLGYFDMSLFSTSIIYMLFYNINILLFLGVFVYLFFPFLNRQAFFFSDLGVILRTNSLQPFYFIIVFSFFSFLGLPPFVGFWGKFVLLKELVKYVNTPIEWFVVIFVYFLTIAGGFSYIRLFNTIGSENIKDNYMLSLSPIKNNSIKYYLYFFIFCQVAVFIFLPSFLFLFQNNFSYVTDWSEFMIDYPALFNK